MERKPNGVDRISEIRNISHQTTKKLGESHEVNESSKRSYKKAI